MCRKSLPAEIGNLLAPGEVGRERSILDDVGLDHHAGDRTGLPTDQGELNAGTLEKDLLDLLGLYLAASDIDRAVLAAEEQIAIPLLADKVTGVDKTLLVEAGGPSSSRWPASMGRIRRTERPSTARRTPSGGWSSQVAGKPARPSLTEKPTPASVDA